MQGEIKLGGVFGFILAEKSLVLIDSDITELTFTIYAIIVYYEEMLN